MIRNNTTTMIVMIALNMKVSGFPAISRGPRPAAFVVLILPYPGKLFTQIVHLLNSYKQIQFHLLQAPETATFRKPKNGA